MKRLAVCSLCLVLLAACETTGGPPPPPIGVSQVQIEPDRYRVTFRGPSRVSQAEVSDRALLGAARLALANGYDWFRVTGRYDGLAPPTTPRISFGIGTSSFGRGGGVSVGGGTGFGGEASFVATDEVVFGKGPKPAEGDAYDAHSVADTLGPRLP